MYEIFFYKIEIYETIHEMDLYIHTLFNLSTSPITTSLIHRYKKKSLNIHQTFEKKNTQLGRKDSYNKIEIRYC